MNPKDVKDHIIRWTSHCETLKHFDGIQMAVNNCLLPLKANHPVEAVDDAERDIEQAIYDRKISIGLIDRRPSDDEATDTYQITLETNFLLITKN